MFKPFAARDFETSRAFPVAILEIVVNADDGIRDGVTFESLAKLKPAFTKDGSMHAGMFFFLVAHKPQDRERGGRLSSMRTMGSEMA